VGLTLVELGDVFKLKQAWAEAARLYTRALQILEPRFGPDHELTGRLLMVCAECNWNLGRKDLARRQKARAARILGTRRSD
jgi:hypothetical protein